MARPFLALVAGGITFFVALMVLSIVLGPVLTVCGITTVVAFVLSVIVAVLVYRSGGGRG